MDPSRTSLLRKALTRELRRRFKKLRLSVYDLIAKEDALGLADRPALNQHSYACVMLVADAHVAGDVKHLQERLDPADVLKLETRPHITVRYGLHDATIGIVKLLSNEPSIRVQFGPLGFFETPKGDALYVSVDSPSLERLNSLLSLFPHTDTQKKYQPHMTVAYMVPGTAAKYLQEYQPLTGRDYTFHDGVLSDVDDQELSFAFNVFCPTGEGGGVDPTCHPSAYNPGITYTHKSDRDSDDKHFAKAIKASRKDVRELRKQLRLAEKVESLRGALSAASAKVDAAKTEHEASKARIAELKKQLAASKARLAVNVFVRNKRWMHSPQPGKVEQFQRWLQTQLPGVNSQDLWTEYARQGFQKGAARAFDDSKKGGDKQQFLRDAFGGPVPTDRVKLLAGRAYNDLDGITSAMSTKMTRVLTDGLVQGDSPLTIAKQMADEVDIAEGRAESIARTEIVRAHAEGQLHAMEELGVDEVGVAVEWQDTPGACPLCAALSGVILTLDEAHGLIPRHPNCRCAWIPALDGGETYRETRDKLDEGGYDDVDIARKRPAGILNMFCPTGEGGGVDPSCGKSGGSGGLEAVPMNRWKETPAPGNGGAHLDHVTVLPKAGVDGPLMKFTGYSESVGYSGAKYKSAEFELVGRAEREAGKETVLRDIHPDEPHSGRDYNAVKAYGTKGGEYVDESPENPKGVAKGALKYWSTPGTAKGEREGGNPQHSVIRDAADRHLGVPGGGVDPIASKVDRLTSEHADEFAKNLVDKVADAKPAQPTLWRGISGVQATQVREAKDGDIVQFTLGSTSRDGNVATMYSGLDGKTATVMRILPGARGIANRSYFAHDQEVITGGKFRVVGRSVSEKTGLTVVDLVQEETFKW